jgi:hypothetical protein
MPLRRPIVLFLGCELRTLALNNSQNSILELAVDPLTNIDSRAWPQTQEKEA